MEIITAAPTHQSLEHLIRPLVMMDNVLISNKFTHFKILLIRRDVQQIEILQIKQI